MINWKSRVAKPNINYWSAMFMFVKLRTANDDILITE